MKKTILITGSNGLLGQKLVELIVEKGEFRLIATGRGNNRLAKYQDKYEYESVDITSENEVNAVFEAYEPDVVIHTAAMTNVDECELNKEACWINNVVATRNIAEACLEYNSHLIHVSTDFIFDGSHGPLTEEEKPYPISFYGYSKLAAEELITKMQGLKWSIARTVLVYGIAQDMSRTNIILWVKKSLEDKKQIKVVDDQWRTPTLAEDLAMGCYLIAQKDKTGVFNISGKDFLNPYEMAMMVVDFFNLDKSFITKADSSTFTQPAKRPPKTGFVIDKARKELGYEPHSFNEGIEILANQISNK
ncbi:MAG: SDR family oxidoreductase [Bacteroidota bacterium]|nr:SDR family oxidoreductase [Bacteroidota bacterium]